MPKKSSKAASGKSTDTVTYLIRNIPRATWKAVSHRAIDDDLDIRWVLQMLLDHYAKGRMDEATVNQWKKQQDAYKRMFDRR